MNYYCVSYQVGNNYKDYVLLHPAYFSKEEFNNLVKEAMRFINNKIKDGEVAKHSREITWAVIGFLMANYNFEYLDTDAIKSRHCFVGYYEKQEIMELIEKI